MASLSRWPSRRAGRVAAPDPCSLRRSDGRLGCLRDGGVAFRRTCHQSLRRHRGRDKPRRALPLSTKQVAGEKKSFARLMLMMRGRPCGAPTLPESASEVRKEAEDAATK